MTLAHHLLPISEHPQFVKLADDQLKVFWLPDEIKVEKDIQDVLVNAEKSEKHGIISTLKLFSLYETHAGDEYWGGRFKKMFNTADAHRMASVFAMFELAVHAPFYNKINQLLHLNDKTFYMSYQKNPVLVKRMEHIDEIINHPDDLVSLAGFSMVEGVILYSNFAYLKHYQSQGKNKFANIVRGINFSVRDENLHSVGGAVGFKIKSQEYGQEYIDTYVKSRIIELAEHLLEHEKVIIAELFAEGPVKGITAHQLEEFVKSRINTCMEQLGFGKIYDVTYNPIADWFYKGINNYVFNDFFAGVGNQYHRDWAEDEFEWKVTNG